MIDGLRELFYQTYNLFDEWRFILPIYLERLEEKDWKMSIEFSKKLVKLLKLLSKKLEKSPHRKEGGEEKMKNYVVIRKVRINPKTVMWNERCHFDTFEEALEFAEKIARKEAYTEKVYICEKVVRKELEGEGVPRDVAIEVKGEIND